MPKVALAYSGRLDSAICIWYLRHVRGMKVVTFSANIGQPEYLAPLAEKAISLGATAAHIADLRERFVREFILPALRADAVYQEGYYLFSALARPLIVQELLEIAHEEGCDTVAHGSRRIGNDRIRFENTIHTLAPEMPIIMPLQDLGLQDIQDEIRYAREQGIPIEDIQRTVFNVEQNLWGANIQLGDVDPWEEPPPETYVLTSRPEEAASRPASVELEFRSGEPVALDAEEMPPLKLVEKVTKIAARHGVGRAVIVEDRILPRKTREIYESPAAAVLYLARRALAAAVLDKDTLRFLGPSSQRYAELVYEGKWFGPLRVALDRMFEALNGPVTGTVRVRLHRGQAAVTGIRSPNSRVGKMLVRL